MRLGGLARAAASWLAGRDTSACMRCAAGGGGGRGTRLPSPPRPILEKFLPLSTSCCAVPHPPHPRPPECSQFPRMDPEAKARRYKGATSRLYRYRIRIRAVSVPDDLYVRAYGYTVYILPTGRGRSGSAPVHPGPGVERVVHVSGARRALAGPAPCLLRRCIPSLCAVDRGLVGSGRFRGCSPGGGHGHGLTARTTARPALPLLGSSIAGQAAAGQCANAMPRRVRIGPSPGLTPECYWTLPGFYYRLYGRGVHEMILRNNE